MKTAQQRGASAWTTVVVMSWATGLVFQLLWLLDGTMQPVAKLYQPATIGAMFVLGQLFTLLAVQYGDVSIAAPVQGVKVLLVPVGAMLILGQAASAQIWIAAAIAMTGIFFVQSSDATVSRSRILIAVLFAFLGAASMTVFDLLIQMWAGPWGPGRFLPIAATATAICGALLMPLADSPRTVLKNRSWWAPLIAGGLVMAVQAIGMTYTLAQFGEATKVNIVFSLRGIWGVLITWYLMRTLAERPSRKIMTRRLIGALLLGAAVVLSLLAKEEPKKSQSGKSSAHRDSARCCVDRDLS